MDAVTVYVTDWSNHNSGALTQAQADGLVSFWHKTTDGDHWYADPFFQPHCDMARSLGVDSLGGYHVLWGNRDLTSQARWFVDRVRAQAPDARVFMSDNEPFGYNVAPTIDQVNAFNLAVVDYALIPSSSALAYCPQWFYGSAISGLRYPWVQSNYGPNPSGPYRSVYEQTVGDQSNRWSGPTAMPFLQYGSRTDVGDANAFRGSAADFFAFLGQSTPTRKGTDVGYFFSNAAGEQYMADPTFERYWAFRGGDGVWDTLYAVAGRPPTTNVTDAQRSSGMFGKYMGVYQDSMPRAPQACPACECNCQGSAEPAKYTVSLTGSFNGSMSGSANPVPPANG